MSRMIYVNLPVRDLPAAKAFYAALGFEFHPKFTNDEGACVIIGETIYVMLLGEQRFAEFTPKPVVDARGGTEVLNCLSCASREEVDDLVRRAVAAGGSTYNEAQDHGFMYGHGFEDPDGHIWELCYMPGDGA